MSRSPKLDEWIEARPDSWVKTVKKGAGDLESFKEAFKRSMREIGKEEILAYISDEQYTHLFEAYGGAPTISEPQKQITSYAPKQPRAREVSAKSYSRRGKSIKGYKSTRTTWSEGQLRFLKHRTTIKDNKYLAKEFNSAFGTNRSVYSIRDKKLRLRQKKK